MNGFFAFFSIIIFSIFYAIGFFINEMSNKGLFFGVRMPLDYEKHENLLALKKDYKKRFNISFLIFTLVYAVTFFVFKTYIFSIFFISIFALLILIHNNFYTTYKKVRKIKKEEAWKFESGKVVVVDLKGGQNPSLNAVNNINDEDKIIINRDDDENYVLGLFYYNKNDPAVFVPKRIGIGTDLNYARPGSKIFLGIILAILIGTLISTFSLSHLMSEGVKEKTITVEASEISIDGMYGIKIPYENIDTIELLETFPKDMIRRNGLEINNTLIGKFKSKVYGNCNLYIMDNSKPSIFIRTKEEKRIFINYENPDRTTELYNEIVEKM